MVYVSPSATLLKSRLASILKRIKRSEHRTAAVLKRIEYAANAARNMASESEGANTEQPSEPAPYASRVASVLANIGESGDGPTSVERSLNLLKTGAEAEKLEAEKNKAMQEATKVAIDATLAAKQLRLSYLSTLTSQLVPLAALLTVGVTFYGSYQQTKQARLAETAKLTLDEAARERVEWETFRNSFDTVAADDLYKRPTFMARLKGFIASGKHGPEIADISGPLLRELTNKSAFTEVWSITYKEIDAKNLDNVVYIARAIRAKYNKVGFECGTIPIPPNTITVDKMWKSLGPCYSGYPLDALNQAYADKPEQAKRVTTLREQVTGLGSIMSFLSNGIATFVLSNSKSKSGAKNYDLSEITFSAVDFSGVDFSRMNLSQTRIYQSNVKGAIFTAPTSETPSDFLGTRWWEAAAIDQTVLRYLVSNGYPGSDQQYYSSTATSAPAALTEDQYVAQVQRLCTSKAAWCDRNCIKFGSNSTTAPPICTN